MISSGNPQYRPRKTLPICIIKNGKDPPVFRRDRDKKGDYIQAV